MAELKTKENNASVEDFLNEVDSEQKRNDSFEIKKMMEEITGEKAKMWGSSIVGFGSYHYKYESGREGDFMRVGFSPRKQNISIYLMSGFDDYNELLEKLGNHKTGKSCLYIKSLEDVDKKVLGELIEASVDYMDKEYPREN